MIDILNKKTLENKFAEDFSSPTFPVLADIYLKEGDIKRAKKVCEVGLSYNATNTDGKFILAKIALAEEKFTVAEKWLKLVVVENPAHFNGFRMLISLEIRLERSPKTIQKFINHLLNFIPHDKECQEWIKHLESSDSSVVKDKPKNIQADSKEVSLEPIVIDSYMESAKNHTYDVARSMATFTMVHVLKTQKHYNQALAVLDVLESMGQDQKKIDLEKEDVLRCIAEAQ